MYVCEGLLDEVIQVQSADAIAFARQLALKEVIDFVLIDVCMYAYDCMFVMLCGWVRVCSATSPRVRR
jgi:hypothetical protein